MKALVKMEPGAGNWQIIDKPEPTINKDQVKIKVEYIVFVVVIFIHMKVIIILMLKI